MTNRNVLPIQTRVRVRAETHVVDVQGDDSGAITLQLDRPSRVTIGTAALEGGCPAFVAAKVDGTPTTYNWDVLLVLRNVSHQPVLATIGLEAGEHTINWAAFDEYGDPVAFLASNLGMIFVAVDA
ncbi:MAG: hypothetical protein ACP5R5_09490 [Armatimonadota bacterium]